MQKRNNKSKIAILLILLITVLVSSNLNWGKDNYKAIIENDAKGYYAYLPALFIYKDLNFGFFKQMDQEKYYDKNLYYEYRIAYKDKTINKYYCGTAVAELPFFLMAHAMTQMTDYDSDGYSKLYPILAWVNSLSYNKYGLPPIFLNKIMILYGVNDWNRAIALVAGVFATNLFYYAVVEPGMSHIYSFAFVSIFIFHAKKFLLERESKYLLYLSLVLGMIVLIRPVNGLVVFSLPFLAGSFEVLKSSIMDIFSKWRNLILGILIFAATIFIQFFWYKASTGEFFVYSYGGEGFHFFAPHIFEILFSYKKGLFLYTPLYLLAFVACVFLWKRSRFEFFAWILFFLLITYVFSSWWMWYYGGSFSSRVYVEYLPLFMILFATLLAEAKTKTLRIALLSLTFVLLAICQIQTYQYRYYEIHWDQMTKEKYWDVFLMRERWN